LLDAHDDNVRVHLVGDGKEMLALAQAAERLQDGKPAGHPELAAFSSWDQVVGYAEKDPAGSDLTVAVRMIEKYGADGVVAAIDGTVPERSAQLIVSTAHKAKGLEWGKVRVANDFKEPLDKETGEPLPIPRADAMLAYVAVTRAMDTLDTGGLGWVHEHLEALGHPAADTVNPDITPTALAQLPVPVLDEHRLTITVGSRVLVAEERGIYVVAGTNKDGSLTCYPATDQGGGARSFRPEWCIPSERPGKGGKSIRIRAVPPVARRSRALWREQHGFLSLDHAGTSPGVAL
jgi:hypothetical protein